MAVEITILSGQRQGDRIELAGTAFEVGDRPTDAVQFDVDADPEAKGHRASLRLEDGEWRIRSTGDLPILVNHDSVERSQTLRSGDIVRMSENGPDFSFALINRLSSSAAVESTAPATATTLPNPVEASPDSVFDAESEPSSVALPMNAVAVAIVGICLLLLGFLVVRLVSSNMKLPSIPALAHVPVASVFEGEEFVWLPAVLNADGVEGLSFALSDERPEGMEIDPTTGAIRWTPTEAQAPGEYQFQLEMTSEASPQHKSTAKVLCIARERNQAPVLESIPSQTLELLKGDSLDLVLLATDSDLPVQPLKFRFDSEVPVGMEIDPSTGRVTWVPTRHFANQVVSVRITVSDNGDPAGSSSGELRVSVIDPNPWVIAADQVRQSLYLVGVQPTDSLTMLPLGTACAINRDTLMTSATVATALEEGRRQGWKVVALNSAKLQEFQASHLRITDLKAHVGWVSSDDAESQLFFDLGLLKIAGRLETNCRLATGEDLAGLVSEPQPLGCIGFELNGGLLTRFDSPTADLKQVELYSVIAWPRGQEVATAAPPLLQLSGELPPDPLGSPVLTRDGKVVGVYADRASLPEAAGSLHIHYAPVVTLVSAWLAGEGQNHWIKPEPTRVTPLNNESN